MELELSNGKKLVVPDGTNQITQELSLFHVEEPDFRFEHLKKCVDLFWNRKIPDSYMWNDWTELMQETFCQNDFVTITGSAASWKTTSAAVYVLTEWFAAPAETVVICTSTTLPGLRRRIWKEITRYYRIDPAIGNLVQSKNCIQFQKGSDDAGIFGIAAEEGEINKAVGRIIGFHSPFIYVLIDEMPYTSEAILEACVNLRTGAKRFKFIGLGNSDNKLDPHGRACEPLNGWDSVAPEHQFWETKRGVCIHLDCYDSPNVKAGRVVYPGLLTQQDIDQTIKDYGEDSPQFWQQRRGFWAPESVSRTVISPALIEKFEAKKKAVWNANFRLGAGLDPAFEGGDRCILRIGKCGMDIRGKMVLSLEEKIKIGLAAGTKDDPLHYQIVRQVKEACVARDIPPNMVAIDSTGEGGGLLSIFHREWSAEVIGIEFGGGADANRRVSDTSMKKANEEYFNKVTQLWFQFRTLLMNGQIRGLDDDTAIEFCQRRWRMVGRLMQAEPKSEMKERTRRSPDDADAVVVLSELFFRTVNDFRQSGLEITQDKRFEKWREKMSADIEEEAYATSGLDF
jgi:hypothetical protein